MEVIIYIPIFAILLGGGVLTAYSLIESSSRNQAIFMVYDEGNFLESKINWVIGGSISVNTPVPGTPSGSLSVTKIDGSNVSINQLGDDITITYGNSAPIILNNRNIKISNLVFDNQVSSTSQLVKSSMLVTVTTGDGKSFAQDFTTSKYIRK